MTRPAKAGALRITCCLCGKPAPARADVIYLDAEWARRHPEMNGRLACEWCVLRRPEYHFECDEDGRKVPGHIDPEEGGHCTDCWSHASSAMTQAYAARRYPVWVAAQGGATYMQWLMARQGSNRPRDDATGATHPLSPPGLNNPDPRFATPWPGPWAVACECECGGDAQDSVDSVHYIYGPFTTRQEADDFAVSSRSWRRTHVFRLWPR